ncbi:MAG TPA: glycosyltransferase family 39 protein [Terriglobia bacterium]|nr:glycosyltransferase family 39 protein [Terriglobia bacterium]
MIPRVLSLATPLFAYISIGLLAVGLYRERKSIEWVGGIAALVALIASFALVPPVHQLFFDEDIYIHIASNLSHAPVAQVTLAGSAQESEASSYFKSPAGLPVLLSLVFLLTGASEAVAFAAARVMYSLLVAGVYHFARRMGLDRWQSIAAAAVVASVPVCFRFSVSAGTDVPAALFAVLGMWGIAAGNGALAAAGLAMAAQTRMEMITLVPLIFSTRAIEIKWKAAAVALALAELLHIGWVLSAAPQFAAFERVPSAFGFGNFLTNFKADISYFFDPFRFPVLVTPLFGIAFVRRNTFRLALWTGLLLGVYLFFYAGTFTVTPRYSIQLAVPMAVLAASVTKQRYTTAALLLSSALAFTQWRSGPEYVPELIDDHAFATELASRLGHDDLVVTTEPEVFLNNGAHAMNAFYAADQPEQLHRELRRYRRVLYYAGAQTNVVNGPEWQADQWMKSHYKLRAIDSRRVGNVRIAYFEVSGVTGDGKGEIRPGSGSNRDGN